MAAALLAIPTILQSPLQASHEPLERLATWLLAERRRRQRQAKGDRIGEVFFMRGHTENLTKVAGKNNAPQTIAAGRCLDYRQEKPGAILQFGRGRCGRWGLWL